MDREERAARRVDLPSQSRILTVYSKTELADAYRIRLPEGASGDAEQLARFIFSLSAPWVRFLLALRDRLVSFAGLKTTRELERDRESLAYRRIGFFRVYEKTPAEILMGEDDRHLDFRISVLHDAKAENGKAYLTLSTVVHCHNRLGEVYLFIIAPFHRLIARRTLERAARAGWPSPHSV